MGKVEGVWQVTVCYVSWGEWVLGKEKVSSINNPGEVHRGQIIKSLMYGINNYRFHFLRPMIA